MRGIYVYLVLGDACKVVFYMMASIMLIAVMCSVNYIIRGVIACA
jgi:hypothetical protein